MKKFTVKVLLFSCLSVCISGSIAIINRNIINNLLEKNYTNVKTLFIGDSHAHWLNEKTVSQSCNLFQGGDTYKAAYYKLLKMHELNPGLENIVLVFGPHNLSQLYENRIVKEKESVKRIYQLTSESEMIATTSDYKGLSAILSRYVFTFNMLPILNEKENDYIHFDVRIKYVDWENCRKKHQSNIESKKNYFFKKISDPEKNKKVCTGTSWYYFKRWTNPTGKYSIKYLAMILGYSNTKGLNILLLNTPVDPDYYREIPDINMERFHAVRDSLNLKYDFLMWDFSNLFECRLDLLENTDHMNEFGGAIISQKIDSLFQI